MRHLRSVSYGFVGILYSRRLILLYSNHLEGRQTVENHLVHMGHVGTRRMHVMTSSFSIFFAVFIFGEAGPSAKIAKICTQRKFPAIWYQYARDMGVCLCAGVGLGWGEVCDIDSIVDISSLPLLVAKY